MKYRLLVRPPASSPTPAWRETRNVLFKSHLSSPSSSSSSRSEETTNQTVGGVGGCSLTQLDPEAPEILPLVSGRPSVSCKTSQQSLVYTREDRLYLNTTTATCFFSYIVLVDTDTYTFSNETMITSRSVRLSGQHCSVWVRCVRNSLYWLDSLPLPSLLLYWLGVEVYRNVLLYVPRLDKPVQSQAEDQYSIVTFIIDAMSQQNLVRSLPLTKAFLDSRGGLLYRGQNKVLHNSYPNVMALLSGERGGWPPNKTGLYYLDQERQTISPTIATNLGYTTLMMEDLAVYGTLAKKGILGFTKEPTDIYYRAPFMAMLEEDFGWLRNRLVGKADCYACLQEQLVHVPELRVVEDFISMYSTVPTFAHIHLNEYTHNDLNMGSVIYKVVFITYKICIKEAVRR